MVLLKCHGCGSEKEVTTAPKEFCCKICGVVNVVVSGDGTYEDACDCICPTNFEWTLPAGIFMNAATGEVTIVTAQGTPMTPKEFIETFGFDPVIACKRMHDLGMNGLPGYYNLSTLGQKKRK